MMNRRVFVGAAAALASIPSVALAGSQKKTYVLALDGSGSVRTENIKNVISTVIEVLQSERAFELHAWSFDTRVWNHHIYTQDNLDQLRNYVLYGGGGTILKPNWEFIQSLNLKPDHIFFATDGYFCDEWVNYNPNIPVTFMIYEDHHNVPPGVNTFHVIERHA